MKDDLISRKALLERLRGNVLVDVSTELEKAIGEQPTAYDKEKVIKEIEGREEASMKEWRDYDDENAFGEMNAYAKAVEIVERGGIE